MKSAQIKERELIINPNGPLEFSHFHLQRENEKQTSSTQTGSENEIRTTDLDIIVSNHIMQVLKQTQGKIHGKGGAAELLGINASTLRNKMNKLGIKYRKNELFI